LFADWVGVDVGVGEGVGVDVDVGSLAFITMGMNLSFLGGGVHPMGVLVLVSVGVTVRVAVGVLVRVGAWQV